MSGIAEWMGLMMNTPHSIEWKWIAIPASLLQTNPHSIVLVVTLVGPLLGGHSPLSCIHYNPSITPSNIHCSDVGIKVDCGSSGCIGIRDDGSTMARFGCARMPKYI